MARGDSLGDTFAEGSNEERRCFLKALANVIWNVLSIDTVKIFFSVSFQKL